MISFIPNVTESRDSVWTPLLLGDVSLRHRKQTLLIVHSAHTHKAPVIRQCCSLILGYRNQQADHIPDFTVWMLRGFELMSLPTRISPVPASLILIVKSSRELAVTQCPFPHCALRDYWDQCHQASAGDPHRVTPLPAPPSLLHARTPH